MQRLRPVLAGWALAFASGAQATNPAYFDLWMLELGFICLAQEPGYRNSSLGRLLGRTSRGAALDGDPSTTCLRKIKRLSFALCDPLMERTESNLLDGARSFAVAHEMELDRLTDVFEYMDRSRARGFVGETPECPRSGLI